MLWRHSAIDIEKDAVFLLATDGVYEHISNRFAAKTIHEHPQDLDEAQKSSLRRRCGKAARTIATLFWKCTTVILACVIVGLLAMQHLRP